MLPKISESRMLNWCVINQETSRVLQDGSRELSKLVKVWVWTFFLFLLVTLNFTTNRVCMVKQRVEANQHCCWCLEFSPRFNCTVYIIPHSQMRLFFFKPILSCDLFLPYSKCFKIYTASIVSNLSNSSLLGLIRCILIFPVFITFVLFAGFGLRVQNTQGELIR